MACVFAEIGQDVHITGGSFEEAVDEGVRQGYTEGYLRKSVVADPIRRGNTGDNTPAVLTVRLVPGDKLRLTLAPKGFGSENMSRLAMLRPSDGEQGVKDFVLDAVRRAGPNPCPPVVVGVGIGGTFDRVALLAKRALLRPLGSRHPDPYYAAMEQELLEKINELGTGPQGFGGRTTALGLQIETFPTHIAGPACGGEHQLPRNPSRGGGAVMEYKLTAPLSKADAAKLRAGDTVLHFGNHLHGPGRCSQAPVRAAGRGQASALCH